MFNREFVERTEIRLRCLETHWDEFRNRLSNLENCLGNLEKVVKRLVCEHKHIIFKGEECMGLGGIPNYKYCADCGKILKYYKTKKEWLEEQLEEERKSTLTDSNTADVTNTNDETVTDGLNHTDHGIGEDKDQK